MRRARLLVLVAATAGALVLPLSVSAGAATPNLILDPGAESATPSDESSTVVVPTASGAVPAGARTAQLTLTMTRTDGSYDDGYADSLSLTIATP